MADLFQDDIHSLVTRSRDWSTSSPQSAIWCFLFHLQYLLFSLRSYSSCLLLLLRLPVTYIFQSFFPSVTCFEKHFLRSMCHDYTFWCGQQ